MNIINLLFKEISNSLISIFQITFSCVPWSFFFQYSITLFSCNFAFRSCHCTSLSSRRQRKIIAKKFALKRLYSVATPGHISLSFFHNPKTFFSAKYFQSKRICGSEVEKMGEKEKYNHVTGEQKLWCEEKWKCSPLRDIQPPKKKEIG